MAAQLEKTVKSPNRSTRRTSAQIAASRSFARRARGATKAVANSGRDASGAGSALRSIFPLAETGNRSTERIVAGIMNSGNFSARELRNSLVVGIGRPPGAQVPDEAFFAAIVPRDDDAFADELGS